MAAAMPFVCKSAPSPTRVPWLSWLPGLFPLSEKFPTLIRKLEGMLYSVVILSILIGYFILQRPFYRLLADVFT
jgi:hypothetical protein